MICSKFITFAVTKTTLQFESRPFWCCDLLKIHYLCGDKDNIHADLILSTIVVICSKFITFAVTKTTIVKIGTKVGSCDLLKIHYLCGDKDNSSLWEPRRTCVVICSKFITFAVTKTTHVREHLMQHGLWFAQNSLPLRWQRQHLVVIVIGLARCDLLKIHYLCGDKDNGCPFKAAHQGVVICSKFITFAVTKTTVMLRSRWYGELWFAQNSLPLRWQRQLDMTADKFTLSCDLLKIHYLCGDKDNSRKRISRCLYVVICSKFITFAVTKTTHSSRFICMQSLWFAQNSLPLRWQRQHSKQTSNSTVSCDLLKIHYLCGDKDNSYLITVCSRCVVICSKFITFAVTKTTQCANRKGESQLWFAQNSLPLRWQRQRWPNTHHLWNSCDLLKIHYLCGDKDNQDFRACHGHAVVICSKFITFAVTKTTYGIGDAITVLLWFAQNSLPLRWQRQHY